MTDHDWPSTDAYLEWARGQGCAVDIITIERDERVLLAIRIDAPSGATVTEIVSELADPLMSSTIARLDRCLGLKSHLFR